MSKFRRRLMTLMLQRQAFRDDFQRVEYIENTSNAYINTLFKNGANAWSFDTTISINQIKNSYLFGSMGSSATKYFQFARLVNGGVNLSTSVYSTTVTNSDNTFVVDKKYHLSGSIKNLTVEYKDIDEETQEEVDKTFTITNGGSYVSNGQPIFIFGIYSKISATNNFNGKLYGFKLYNSSGTLIRDFIPMHKISTDEYGLWDRVEEKFYGSANSSKFSGGDEVIADNNDVIYYIKNYINTYQSQRYLNIGIAPKETDYFETKIYLPTTGRNYACGAWSSNNSNMYGLQFVSATQRFVYDTTTKYLSAAYGNKTQIYKEYFDFDTNIMHFYIYNTSGTQLYHGQTAKESGTASKNFLIGDFNGSSYGATNNTRFYYFKYYRNGELVRDYIAAQRCSDGVWGFFDKARNIFQTSSGSQPFTGG